MRRHDHRAWWLGLLMFLASGCATGRDIIDVRVPPGGGAPTGPLAYIERVTDQRQFEADPRTANIPSLMNAEEIRNPAITSRAIARKRGGFGKALGDILLPEGRTVMVLVEEALTRALRDAGYRVVGKQDAGAASAIPVEAEIEQFWAYFRPGFAQIAVEFETRVRIKAAMPGFQTSEPVKGASRVTGQAATESKWIEAVNKGLDDFAANMSARAKRASRGQPIH